MDGIYLNKKKVEKSIQDWMNTVDFTEGKWEANNLHIDEIDTLDKATRSEWIDISFMILNILTNRANSINPFILFLHIDLKDSFKETTVGRLSLSWLKKHISEYTPPSLNITSLDYYMEFYEKELVACVPESSILELIHYPQYLDFFYRTYFDENENMFSREIYIFIKSALSPVLTDMQK